jgi:preprotein translocase subunit SecA
MDHQRKRVYGYRQEILDGGNCKIRLLDMLDEQINLAVDRFQDEDYGPSSFAEFAAKRLGVEFDASDFSRTGYTEAEKAAREKASRQIPTQIHEAMEENLGSEDPGEWNWQALAHTVNTRWGLKTSDRELKKIGKDNLAQHLIELAEKAVEEVDLSQGEQFLNDDWGRRSICDWARLKFQIKLAPEELAGKDDDAIKALLHEQVTAIYRQKETEFPVKVGMARFMADRQQGPTAGGQRYDREGLYHWARIRFPGFEGDLSEEAFRTDSRARLQERLLAISGKYFPKSAQQQIDARLEDSFSGTRLSEPEDAKELADWVRSEWHLEVPEAALTGVTKDQARQVLWNAFDDRNRPEMRGMERSLLLGRLDAAWKNHLYTMDHLRSGIGLMGYAQVDPKTEYKRQGMKEFDAMWESLQDKITDTLFRMEEEEGFQEALWTIGSMVHESAPRPMPAANGAAVTNAPQGDKKPEPIRNRGDRVGRNDPCPCGSGKKYKNCHMRQAAG